MRCMCIHRVCDVNSLLSLLTVDIADESGRVRTICSGLVKHVPLEDMQVCHTTPPQ